MKRNKLEELILIYVEGEDYGINTVMGLNKLLDRLAGKPNAGEKDRKSHREAIMKLSDEGRLRVWVMEEANGNVELLIGPMTSDGLYDLHHNPWIT